MKNNLFKVFATTIVLIIIAFLCVITATSFLYFRINMIFTPSTYYSQLEIPVRGSGLILVNEKFGKITRDQNSGSASGYVYKIYDSEDVVIKELISCGEVYWSSANEDELLYIGPDYSSGTTTCSAWLSGKFIENRFSLR